MERLQAVCSDADVVEVLDGTKGLSGAGAAHGCAVLHTVIWSCGVDVEVSFE